MSRERSIIGMPMARVFLVRNGEGEERTMVCCVCDFEGEMGMWKGGL